jgi:PBP1b-binding outer membrane lipoprotein LpoB
MKTGLQQLMVIALAMISAGCSDSGDRTPANKQDQDHAWKGQTQAIDKAQGVETMLLDSAKARRQKAEQQAR